MLFAKVSVDGIDTYINMDQVTRFEGKRVFFIDGSDTWIEQEFTEVVKKLIAINAVATPAANLPDLSRFTDRGGF